MRSLTSLVLSLAIGSACYSSAVAQEKISFRMMGLPLASGNIQKNREQPFFENLAQRTGLPITVDYKTLDTTGIKEFEQLRIMRSGLFDLVTLRLAQVSRDEPSIIGLDLVGLNPNYEIAQKVVTAYLPIVSEQLEKKFNTKLLGVWPFGPQLIFCKPPVKSLADLKGLKIRVFDGVMAKFMERVGAIPVTMATSEVAQALSLGTIDCGITGPSTANSAGWPESVTHVYPIGVQSAMQGYGISLKAWNSLTPEQRNTLQKAIETLTAETWAYSRELYDDAMRCNAGEEPCKTGRKYRLVTSPVQPQDLEVLKTAVRDVALPAWKSVCDTVDKECTNRWVKSVGPIIGIQ